MTSLDPSTYVDACFQLGGGGIPLDHGYMLLGAVARLVPIVHERKGWGLHPVRGLRGGGGDRLTFYPGSKLQIRLPASEIASLFPLIGSTLNIAGATIAVGALGIEPLHPAARLISRVVTIKGFLEPEPFLDACRKQLVAVEGLGQDPERIDIRVAKRRVIRIHDKRVVGFQVWLDGLDTVASIALQRAGLGGRRHMGAGLFVPVQRMR